MKIAVVADKSVPPWSIRQIMLAIEELGASSMYLRPSGITSIIGGNDSHLVYSNTLKPFEIDGVILRDLGVTTTIEIFLRRIDIFRHIEELGVPVVNSVNSYIVARDKYLSLLLLSKAGIPTPKTAVVEDFYSATKLAESWGKVVVKPLIGSMGFGIIKAEDPDTVYNIARTLSQLRQPIYIQEYIEKPGRDIRILVIGDEIVAAYYRVQQSVENWKTNIAQGARVDVIEKLNEELESLSFKILKTLNLYYAGIDVAETKNGYVVFEVNASPQWRGVQRAVGINPAKKLAKYVISLTKQ
ncbi:MAG: RimK family alpha-L-glutamate ligase [Ignisphaera sp.]|nr:RimK family alpha-L-glutamate ligase [Ignisphaera sp.]MCX8168089.1 RimK family alpha-L-glutamate ligase [Ignisphaera sp.]MDW8085913.1 RimK family alpha-L-glutamate ligase [Ignisphaera sp.]